jgi:Ca2+-binding RTX toxin-like protein
MACPILIVGTNGDDDITVVARDASYILAPMVPPAGLDGVQDFTVSVNGGPDVLFIDQPDLYIDALNGDDDIVVRTRAPNLADWNVHVRIVGGPPSAVTGDQGDVVEVETPGDVVDTVFYTPTGSDTGELLIDEGGMAGVFDSTDTLIEILTFFTIDCPPADGILEYQSSEGGAEALVYDGEGSDDLFTLVGTDMDDTILHNPSAAGGIDEGFFRVNTLLGISYQNLGAAGTISVDGGDGEDTLVINGTDLSETFTVEATTGAVTVDDHLAIAPVPDDSVENLELNGLEGDDDFIINFEQPYAQIAVNGGGPGASDTLTVAGAMGVDEEFTVDLDPAPGDGIVTVNAVLNPYTGIEHLFLDANGGDVDNVTINDDLRDNLWDVSAGSFGDLVQIAGRESIDYDDFNDVTLNNVFGTDLFRIYPTNLSGFAGTFLVNGDAALPIDDVLQLIGTPGQDTVTSTMDTITVNDVGITVGDNLVEVHVSTLAGADDIDLDLALPGVLKIVNAGSGHDFVDMSGTMDADIFGGDGDDFLIGSPVDDFIDGGRGEDTMSGLGGNDRMLGGEGNDIIIGDAGADSMFGNQDSDILIWNPGDGDDLMEGGEGRDKLQFTGGAGVDTFTMRANGARLRFEREPGGIVLDVAGVEEVDVDTSVTFAGELTGDQEAPVPVATAARGFVDLVYDADTNKFAIDIFITGIAQADITMSHIHNAAFGVAGGIIFDLGAGAAWTAQDGGLRRTITDADFPLANIADLLAGNTYVNVHTTAFGGGEIRGQLNLSDRITNPPLAPATALAGADSFTVFDLTTTEVEMVNLGLGDAAAPATDSVTVHGRKVADNITVTATPSQGDFPNFVDVIGVDWDYDVRISGSVAAGAAADDGLTVRGNEGDDIIKAYGDLDHPEPVEATIDITLHGGAGADFLSADAVLIGGDGDDVLEGGDGVDMIFGDDPMDPLANGEDTIIASRGDDTIDGGPQFDTIVIRGSSDADLIDVRQPTATTIFYNVDAPAPEADLMATDTITSVEGARIEGRDGADTIRVAIDDALFDDAGVSLRMTVVGGDDQASDRLGIVDVGTADLSILRQNHDITAGTVEIGPGNAEPFLHVFSEIEFVQVLADTLAPGAPVNIETAGTPNRLVVFKDDPYEHNNDRNNATHLGANETINLDPTIDPGPGAFGFPADSDWYRVEALVSGTIDFQVIFEQIATVGARPGLPGAGDLNIQVFDVDGTAIANFTTSDDNDDNERVRIPAVQGEIYYFRVLGDAAAINAYDVTVINLPALTPYDLELDDEPVGDPPPANSDTGRNDNDNVTRDNTPTIVFRLDDAFFLNDLPGNDVAGTPLGDAIIPIPFRAGPAQPAMPGYAIAIFDEGDTPGGPANEEPQTPLGFATMVEPGVYQFTTPVLLDGSHFLTARVQMLDPATPLRTGFGPRSVSLEIFVDTVEPPVSFGEPGIDDDGIVPDDDSGVSPPNPDTIRDRVTNERSPTFWGRAEANTIIRLFADLDDDGVLDANELSLGFAGQATAIPIDGNEQEGVPPNMLPHTGFWTIKTVIDFNDEDLFPDLDGVRTLFVTAEDLAGNITGDEAGEEVTFDFFLDTQGPVVNFVQITAFPAFDLFDPKPTPAPTPLVDSLTIKFTDLPPRIADFLYPALKADTVVAGHFRVVGDHNGIIPIEQIVLNQFFTMMNGDTIAMATVELRFFEPLPDDRFTLLIEDDIMDPVGNRLDGETNAPEPVENPIFPTGDGVPGFDFVARFTVDSRPEVAVWSGRTVFVDTNGNQFFDPRNQIDFTDRDVVYYFGLPTDDMFVGNFALDFGAVADGFDKLASYGNIGGGNFRFLIDNDNDGVPDPIPGGPTANINGVPVAGNFDGNAANGDEVGLFDGAKWFFDANHNFRIDGAETAGIASAIRGLPIVGDFNGDGFEDLATFNDFRNRFEIDLATGLGAGYGNINVVLLFGFPGTNDQPVAADFNQDGIDDLGLFAPQQGAGAPDEQGYFHLLISQGDPALPLYNTTAANADQATAAATPTDLAGVPGLITVQLNFEPIPFGNDTLAIFGEDFATPLWGNFDPPVGPGTGTVQDPIGTTGTDTNPGNNLDVNDDGNVTVADILVIVQGLRAEGGPYEAPEDNDAPYPDVNSSGMVTVQDMLPIVDFLRNEEGGSGGEGEAEDSAPGTSQQFVGILVSDRRNDAAREAAVTAAAAGPAADAIDAVAEAVAAAGASSADAIDLSDDESDEIDDAIDAIIGDLVQA